MESVLRSLVTNTYKKRVFPPKVYLKDLLLVQDWQDLACKWKRWCGHSYYPKHSKIEDAHPERVLRQRCWKECGHSWHQFFFFFELEKLVFSYQREEGREIGIKGFKYVVMEKNLTLGCKHAMQCVYDLLSNCTLETYWILLINVTAPKRSWFYFIFL